MSLSLGERIPMQVGSLISWNLGVNAFAGVITPPLCGVGVDIDNFLENVFKGKYSMGLFFGEKLFSMYGYSYQPVKGNDLMSRGFSFSTTWCLVLLTQFFNLVVNPSSTHLVEGGGVGLFIFG
jgi:hypothetical protein